MKIRYQLFVLPIIMMFCSLGLQAQNASILVNPQSVDTNVPLNGATSAAITINNNGSETLNWNIFEDDVSVLLNNGRSIPLQFAKSSLRATTTASQGFGGPDAFGYMFIDSDEPGGPEFNFRDLRTQPGAFTLPLGDDDSFTLQLQPLQFSFPFYGENKTTITIGSNGYITFGNNDGTQSQNTALPNPANPNSIIAPFWDDLAATNTSNASIQFFFDATAREIIVQYSDVRRLSSPEQMTFQVILKSDGKILFQYLSMPGVLNQSTIGIENADGSTGLQVAFNTNYVHDNLAMLFSPGCSWLATDSNSGSVAPGAFQDVEIQMNAAGLPAGIYNCDLQVNSNDPQQEQIVVPVQFIVGPPIIVVSPLALDFGDVFVASSASQTVTVRNDGELDLLVNSASFLGANAGEFSIVSGGAPFTVSNGQTRNVTVNFTPSSIGAKSAILQFDSNDPNVNPVDVSLAGNGVTPEISVNPSLQNFGDVKVLESVSQNFIISNDGNADLTISGISVIGSNPGDFTITGGGNLGVLAPGQNQVVSVNFSPLNEGLKSAALRIDNNDLDENPFDVALSGNGTVPDISVIPSPHDYGDVLLGESGSQTFVVSNVGAASLVVSSTVLNGANAADFNIDSGGGAFTLATGGSRNITVRFTPAALSLRTASLDIASDDPDESNFGVALSGTGVTPEISVTPTSHNYGEVRLGASAQQTFTVSNVGTADLTISATTLFGLNADQYSFESGNGAFVLTPGSSRNIVINFAPTALGTQDAVLMIDNNDLDENPFDIPLTGTGVTPEIAVNPISHDYGDIFVQESAAQTFVISNEGTADLAVSNIKLIGRDAGEFAIISGGEPVILAPGANQDVVVNFAPLSEGVKSATLQINSDDLDESQFDIPLAGNAITPEIAVNPGAFDFGGVKVFSVVSQSVTIKNEGSADLTITSINMQGANAGEFSIAFGGEPGMLVPGDSQTVIVNFNPLSPGAKSATLRIENNDLDESQFDVSLAGTGTVPDISVAPQSYNYGDVLLSTSASQTFVISNDGQAELVITATNLTGANASDFTIENGGPITLAPGENQNMIVHFTPADLGSRTASVQIASDDPDESNIEIPLTGNGVTPEITANPASYDFGDVRVATVVSQTITIKNDGNADLLLSGINLVGADILEFSITSGGTPGTLAPGDSQSVVVNFAPQSPGSKSATLRIDNDDLDENPTNVPLTGNAVTPEIAVNPVSHNYGDVKTLTSASQSFTIKNEGTAGLTISGISLLGENAGEFSIVFGGEPGVLAPGDSQTVILNFMPLTPGAKSANLQIDNDDLDESQFIVPLSGAGVVPMISVSPTSHDYGDVLLGTTVNQTFLVSNTGEAELVVDSTTVSGSQTTDFNIVSGGAPFTLAPGENQTIVVSFSPDSLGSRNAMLQIISDDPGNMDLAIPLAGMGITPEITVTPATFNFGEVRRDSTAQQTFVVTNDGNADLSVTAATITGENADQYLILSGAAPFSLVPGATQNIVVSFAPTSVGAKNAALTIASNDLDESTLDVSLTGTAIAPDIALQPDSLGFGTLQAGQSIARSTIVSNLGDALLKVSAVTLTGADTTDFAILSNDSSFALLPGEAREIAIGFNPQLTGLKTAALRIEHDDLDENPFSAPLTGNAIADTIQVVKATPAFFDFGDVPVLESASQIINIINEGTAHLTVDSTKITGPDSVNFTLATAKASVKIAPGDTLKITANFNPDSVKTHTATLQVFNNDPDESVLNIPLSGNGIIAPNIVVEPAAHNFGDVFAGNTVAQTFVVRNSGFLDLIVNSLTVTGSDASEFSITSLDSSFVLAPADSKNVIINFTPVTPSTKSANLQITSNDPNENPLSVALSGTGIVSDIAVAPDTVNFGDVGMDSTQTTTLFVINEATATADLVVSQLAIFNADSSEFSIVNGNTPFTLAPGDTQSVALSLTPRTTGSKHDTLEISSNDPDESILKVPLTGRGIIELAHDFLFLGQVKVSFDNHAGSEGDAHSNVDISFRGTSNVVTHTGNLTAVDDITLRANNLVDGDVTAGDKIELGGTVTGTVTTNANVSVIPLPLLSFTAGGQSVTHSSGDTLSLPPGSYNNVTVEDQSILVLSAGEYFMNILKLDDGSKISADISGGIITVNVVSNLDFDSDAEVLTFPSDDVDEFSTEKLTFNALQSSDIDVGNRVMLVGSLIAPNSEVTLGQNVHFKGGICAERTRARTGVFAVHHSSDTPLSGLLAKRASTEEALATLPEKFELKQNYPNPFNPTTIIEYSVAFELTPVKIEIYDLTGRRVKTLINETQEPGFYSIEWDGRNEHKSRVAAGFYVYRMVAGSFVESRKMLLVK